MNGWFGEQSYLVQNTISLLNFINAFLLDLPSSFGVIFVKQHVSFKKIRG